MTGTRIFGRFSLASMIGSGFAVVWIVFSVWLIIGLSMMAISNTISKYPQVMMDGRILITEYDQQTHQRTAKDLQGNDEPNPDNITQASNLTLVSPKTRGSLDSQLQSRIFGFSDQKNPRNFWYFVLEPSSEEQTTGYFVGYYSRTRERIGYLGSQGFSEMKPAQGNKFVVSQAEFASYNGLFSTSGNYYPNSTVPNWSPTYQQGMDFPPWVVYLWSKPSLLKIDLSRRSVEKVFESEKVVTATRFYKQQPLKTEQDASDTEESDADTAAQPTYTQKQMIAFQEKDRVTLFDPKDHSTSTLFIPEELQNRKQSITVYQTANDYVAIDGHYGRDWQGETYYEAIRFDHSGKITERHERIAVTRGGEWGFKEQIGLAYAVVLPTPVFSGILTFCVIPMTIPSMNGQPYSAALLEALSFLWLGLLLLLCVSGYLAYITLKRERRFHSEYAIISVVFVFLFGWFGYVGYRLHRRWPIDRTISPAKRDGTEIFRSADQTELAETRPLAASV